MCSFIIHLSATTELRGIGKPLMDPEEVAFPQRPPPLQSWRTEAQSLLLVCSLILALGFRINHHLQQDQMINALRHTIGIEKLILNQYILHKIQ